MTTSRYEPGHHDFPVGLSVADPIFGEPARAERSKKKADGRLPKVRFSPFSSFCLFYLYFADCAGDVTEHTINFISFQLVACCMEPQTKPPRCQVAIFSKFCQRQRQTQNRRCSPGGDSCPGVAHLRGQGVRLQQRGAEVAGQRGSQGPSGGRGAFGAGKVSAAGVAQQDVHPFPPQLWAAGRSNVYCDSPRVAQYVLHSSHIDVSPNSLSVLSSQITSEQFLGNLSADRSAKKTGALAVS